MFLSIFCTVLMHSPIVQAPLSRISPLASLFPFPHRGTISCRPVGREICNKSSINHRDLAIRIFTYRNFKSATVLELLLRTRAIFSTSDIFTRVFRLITLPRNSSTVDSKSLRSFSNLNISCLYKSSSRDNRTRS